MLNSAVKRGLICAPRITTRHELAASEPVLNQHNTNAQRGAWVPPTKSNIRYEIPRAYMPFYDVARVSAISNLVMEIQVLFMSTFVLTFCLYVKYSGLSLLGPFY